MLMWSNVHEFKDWWFHSNKPIKPPFDMPTFSTGIAYSLCLYRKDQFQVELYIIKPDSTAPSHSHPNVDSVFVYLGGNLEFGKEDGTFDDLSMHQESKPNGVHKLFGVTAEAMDGSIHSVRAFKEGGAFLSFEHWKDRKPDSVIFNWQGAPDSDRHQQILDAK